MWQEGKPFGIGILLKDLVVTDIDDPQHVAEWEARFPILQTCPKQQTTKGFHYILGRTASCVELGLYDKGKVEFCHWQICAFSATRNAYLTSIGQMLLYSRWY